MSIKWLIWCSSPGTYWQNANKVEFNNINFVARSTLLPATTWIFMSHVMKRQFNACQTTRSMYLYIFNNFRVIRCLSQCVSSKNGIFTTFLFPWGRPWGNHPKCCIDWKIIRCLQSVSQHVPIYPQQFPRYSNRRCKKIAVFAYQPTFLFTLETPLQL